MTLLSFLKEIRIYQNLKELVEAIAKIDPDGREIAELMMAGESDNSIANILGIPRSTFAMRKAKISEELSKAIVNFL